MCLFDSNQGHSTAQVNNQLAAEQRQIDRTRAEINKTFDQITNETRYGTLQNDVRDRLLYDLNQGRKEAERKNRFQLARGGQLESSVHGDKNRKLQRLYEKGVMDAGEMARQEANRLREADENAKQRLLMQADKDAKAATDHALNQLRLNAAHAQASMPKTALSDIFKQMVPLTASSTDKNSRYTPTVTETDEDEIEAIRFGLLSFV
ncbi:hypothetical protein ACQZV8_10740 [Magnetococcales bacterium HHB-1]